jgi:hypothetical protein
MKPRFLLLAVAVATLAVPGVTRAQSGPIKAARELARAALRRSATTAAKQGEDVARQFAAKAARYGDDVAAAARKLSPKAASVADEAGEFAPQAIRLLAKHGDDAIAVAARPESLRLVARFGDDAAAALVKHPGAAEPLLNSLGAPAASALKSIGAREARRLAILQSGGELAALGRTDDLLKLIGRHGDKALNFIWENKTALASTALMTAFIADPEPYLNGTKELVLKTAELTADVAVTVAKTAGEAALTPIVNAAAQATGTTAGPLLRFGVIFWAIGTGLIVAKFAARVLVRESFRKLRK